MATQHIAPAELAKHVGQRVTLHLTADAPAAPQATGRLVGTLDAADGLVAFLEPDGQPGKRVTYHHHYITRVSPA